jgi:hypothetical protein
MAERLVVTGVADANGATATATATTTANPKIGRWPPNPRTEQRLQKTLPQRG